MSTPASAQPAHVTVAIVGCGYIGNRHARVLAATPGVSVTALIDPTPERSAAIANLLVERGASRPAEFTSLTSALSTGDFDTAVVCTPSGLHATVAVESIHAGRHTLIEKPIEVTLVAADKIAAAAAEHPEATVSVVSQHRFDGASQLIRRAIDEGRLGRLTSGLATLPWWRTQEYYDSGDWRGTWALDGGGALMNQGVHNLDLLVWLLGEPVEVFAHTALLAHERVEVEDTVVATITFASGALATMHATTAAYPGLTPRIYVNGQRGTAVIDNDRLDFFHAQAVGDAVGAYGSNASDNQADTLRGGPAETYPTFEDELEAGHRRQWDDFLRAVRAGVAPGVTVADATVALATVRAVYESARIGRPVLVAEVRAGRYAEAQQAARG